MKKARAYACGLGWYELRINGRKAGDHVLEPGITRYDKTVLYTTYDIESFLNQGGNVVAFLAGNGRYGYPKVLLQLNIEYEDGSTEIIVTEPNTWLAGGSPITVNGIYKGETYDARLEIPGWDSPGQHFGCEPQVRDWTLYYISNNREEKPKNWQNETAVYRAMCMPGPGGSLKSQMTEPIKVVEEISIAGVNRPKPGIFVFDMGRNMAGWVRLKVSGAAGLQVKLRFAEMLYEDGTVNQENLGSNSLVDEYYQTDIYILKGDGREIYEPRFTFHGFRYLQVEGYPGEPGPVDITGCVVRSAVQPVGSFRCSSELLNRILENIVRTEASNLHSIPTDCPQRNERFGWLNDMTVRAEEAVYNFNMARFYTKWVGDIRDSQDAVTGAIGDTAPYLGQGMMPTVGVYDKLAAYYGDPQFLYTKVDNHLIREKNKFTPKIIFLDILTFDSKLPKISLHVN